MNTMLRIATHKWCRWHIQVVPTTRRSNCDQADNFLGSIDIATIGGFSEVGSYWYYPTVPLDLGPTNDSGDCKAHLAYEGRSDQVNLYYSGVDQGDPIGHLECTTFSGAEEYPGSCWKKYSVDAGEGATAQDLPRGKSQVVFTLFICSYNGEQVITGGPKE
jgi:hypothetical protein